MSEQAFSKRDSQEQGWEISECPRCQGRGYVTRTYDDYGMADPKDVQCPTCKGMTRVRISPVQVGSGNQAAMEPALSTRRSNAQK